MSGARFDNWAAGESYDAYMGRWSRRLAGAFVAWLAPPREADWIEVGCGTGALTAAVVAAGAPRSLLSVDPSDDFLAHARSVVTDERVRFAAGEAARLPARDASADVVTSGLVLNFVPDREAALVEALRVLWPGGLLGFYVWDYPGGGMQMMSRFWAAAAELDPGAGELGEGARFGYCTREGLTALLRGAGFEAVAVEPIAIETLSTDFEDYWHPFTLGAGPAPGYVKSLPEEMRNRLRERLAERLGPGPIRLSARAWAARGRAPG